MVTCCPVLETLTFRMRIIWVRLISNLESLSLQFRAATDHKSNPNGLIRFQIRVDLPNVSG